MPAPGRRCLRDLGASSWVRREQVTADRRLEAFTNNGGQVGDGPGRQSRAGGVVDTPGLEKPGVQRREISWLEALQSPRAERRQQVQPEVAGVAVVRLRTHLRLQDRQPVGHPLLDGNLLRPDERPSTDMRPRCSEPCTCLLVGGEPAFQLPAPLPRSAHVDDDEVPAGGFLAYRLGRHDILQTPSRDRP